jgi:hypothetical protein
MSVLYADLRRIVRGVMASEGQHHALRPASVVKEAFVGLVQAHYRSASAAFDEVADWRSRAYFLSVAARQIRLVLADYTRRRSSRVPLTISVDDDSNLFGGAPLNFVVLDEILKAASDRHTAMVRILEMDCFGGMTDQEIGLIEHISAFQARIDRESARNWLSKVLASKAGFDCTKGSSN